jgi:hypothetical protein
LKGFDSPRGRLALIELLVAADGAVTVRCEPADGAEPAATLERLLRKSHSLPHVLHAALFA